MNWPNQIDWQGRHPFRWLCAAGTNVKLESTGVAGALGNLIKEPLLHFLVAGAMLFGLYAWVNPDSTQDSSQILVDSNRIDLLASQFQRSWNRPPTQTELQGLIDNFIVEEILYRQALAMGLDSDDNVIRRRLRQKMEFLTLDTIELKEPSDQELKTFLNDHSDQFQTPAIYSFEQFYIGDVAAEELASGQLKEIQSKLEQGLTVESTPSLLPSLFTDTPAFEIDRQFGQGFAKALQQLPIDQWSPPIQSGLGIHFVRITSYQPPSLPELSAVRSQVIREWQNAENQKLKASLLEKLKASYTIVIEEPKNALDKNARTKEAI